MEGELAGVGQDAIAGAVMTQQTCAYNKKNDAKQIFTNYETQSPSQNPIIVLGSLTQEHNLLLNPKENTNLCNAIFENGKLIFDSDFCFVLYLESALRTHSRSGA